MDEHYNFQTAGMLLLVISTQSNIIYLSNNSQQYHGRTPEIQTRRTTCYHEISKGTMLFSNICLIETLQEYINAFTIEKTTYPTCWRILRGINRVEKQELVMRIQGIISLKYLPPLQLG